MKDLRAVVGANSPDAKWPYPAKACVGVIMNFYD